MSAVTHLAVLGVKKVGTASRDLKGNHVYDFLFWYVMKKKKSNGLMDEYVMPFITKMAKDHVAAYAAQGAFFLLMSFIPFIMLLMMITQVTPLSSTLITDTLVSVVPDEFQEVVQYIISSMNVKTSLYLPLMIILALWSSCKALLSLTYGLNTIFHVRETRNYFVNRFRSMGYTFVISLALIVTLFLVVFGKSIQSGMEKYFPNAASFTNILMEFRSIIVLFVLMFLFLMLYCYLPNRVAKPITQLPGAVVAAIGWEIISLFFSLYMQIMPGVSNMYGGLTTIMILMLWLYAGFYAILIGAMVNDFLDFRIRNRENLYDITGPHAMDAVSKNPLFYESEEDEIGEETTPPQKSTRVRGSENLDSMGDYR